MADSNLRFYLAALRTAQDQNRRGRPEAGFRVVERRWSAGRGRAIEPLIRDALTRAALAGELPWPDVEVVGGWWNRAFNPEIDLVGADRGPVARQIFFAGSAKWLGTAFDGHDFTSMREAIAQLPDFVPGSTGTVVVSRSGVASEVASVDLVWGPQDILAAWSGRN